MAKKRSKIGKEKEKSELNYTSYLPSLVKLCSMKICDRLNTQYVTPPQDLVNTFTNLPEDNLSLLFPFLHYRWVILIDRQILLNFIKDSRYRIGSPSSQRGIKSISQCFYEKRRRFSTN